MEQAAKSVQAFDRKGYFITMIGSIGQGPGEYQTIYDAQIDEKTIGFICCPGPVVNCWYMT